jgi:hypothetical protein
MITQIQPEVTLTRVSLLVGAICVTIGSAPRRYIYQNPFRPGVSLTQHYCTLSKNICKHSKIIIGKRIITFLCRILLLWNDVSGLR